MIEPKTTARKPSTDLPTMPGIYWYRGGEVRSSLSDGIVLVKVKSPGMDHGRAFDPLAAEVAVVTADTLRYVPIRLFAGGEWLPAEHPDFDAWRAEAEEEL